MILNKCCCCFSLKYGYLSYGIISMSARLIAVASFFHAASFVTGPTAKIEVYREKVVAAQIISVYSGWIFTAAASLFFALKGIIQKRSILLYPYIVVLVVELIGLFFAIILSSILLEAYYAILLPVSLILAYELWCLISLYKHMKNNEKIRYIGEMQPLKTI